MAKRSVAHLYGNQRARRHGCSGSKKTGRAYNSWVAMKARCLNPHHKFFFRYGGRGITIYEPWLVFENFLRDVGENPPRTTLDRYPNPAGNYEPGNVRWATRKEQQNNRRTNITLHGETKSVKEWLEFFHRNDRTYHQRRRAGWSIEDALMIAPLHRGRS